MLSFEVKNFSQFTEAPTFGKLIKWLVENGVLVKTYWLNGRYHCSLYSNGTLFLTKSKSPKKALLKAIKELGLAEDTRC